MHINWRPAIDDGGAQNRHNLTEFQILTSSHFRLPDGWVRSRVKAPESLVADVVLWKDWRGAVVMIVSVIAFVPVTISCPLSPMSCCFSSLFFFWAKAANLLNRPLPPLPDLEISKETIARVADALQIWLNLALFVAHDISIENNFLLCLQVVGVLWVISYIGSLFNFLNFDLHRCSSSLVFPWVYYYEPGTRRKFRSLLSVQRHLAGETGDYNFIESGAGRKFGSLKALENFLLEENACITTPKSAVKSGTGEQMACGVRSDLKPVQKCSSVAEEDQITPKSSKHTIQSALEDDNRASMHNLTAPPPAKVSWVLSSPGGFWSPFLDDSIVPESEKLKWSKAFVLSIHDDGGFTMEMTGNIGEYVLISCSLDCRWEWDYPCDLVILIYMQILFYFTDYNDEGSITELHLEATCKLGKD
ncbi:Reticulon-like protein B11 [Glycine soja]